MAKKLGQGGMLTTTGVTPSEHIRDNAYVMVLTAISYLIIQGPAFAYSRTTDEGKVDELGSEQHYWALAGLVVSGASFFG